MKNEINLIPSYWASVSGGKDSLFMLKLLMDQRERYPLDGVIHLELEIDYPFIKDVVNEMELMCKAVHVPFLRFKPSRTWEEIYYSKIEKTGNIVGFPTRKVRWCNSKYKLSAFHQFVKYLLAQGRSVVSYIGYCVDEEERYTKRHTKHEIYPLVENGIFETDILQWAQNQPIFNNYYLTNKRCGCMYCPMASYINYAYLYKYYPEQYKYMIDKMRETERIREDELGRPFSCIQSNPIYNADYLDNQIKTRYIHELEYQENNVQLSFF